ERLDERVLRAVEVGRRVPVRRAVTAPDVAALVTAAQMDPPATHGEALDAPVTDRRSVLDRVHVRAVRGHLLAPGDGADGQRCYGPGVQGRTSVKYCFHSASGGSWPSRGACGDSVSNRIRWM